MTEEEIVYKEDIPGWYFILGPISSILIGQTKKGIIGIVASFILSIFAGLGGLVWILYIVDSYMINKYMNEKKKGVGEMTFFWQLPKDE